MSAIFKREFVSYFTSPVAYVVLAAVMFFSGIFVWVQCLYVGTSDMSSVFQSMFFIMLFVIPLITMRLFSEDKKQKTDQALLTAPVSIAGIVSAKFLSALLMLLLCLCSFIVDGVALSFIGYPDWSVIIGNVFGMVLMGASLAAVGIFVSSLTESVIVAAIVSFAVNVLISLLDTVASTMPVAFLKNFVSSLSFQTRYGHFALGLFPLSDIIYFASVCLVFLFLTDRVLERRRWA